MCGFDLVCLFVFHSCVVFSSVSLCLCVSPCGKFHKEPYLCKKPPRVVCTAFGRQYSYEENTIVSNLSYFEKSVNSSQAPFRGQIRGESSGGDGH